MTAADPLYVQMNTERIRQDVSVQDWADAAGVHVSTVYNLLRGDTRGMVFIAQLLAEALGLELTVRPRGGAGPDRGG